MILSRVRLLPQIRYDLEDFIAQQSGVRTDNKFYTQRFMSGENYIVKGFTLGGIGLNQATIEMDEATLIFPQNTSDFSWYTAEDSPDDIVIEDADLTDGAKNYIEISIVTETNTPVTKAFWDPAANSGEGAEFTQEVDTMTDLSVAVDVRTGGFSGDPDKIPLAVVEVNGSGTIVGILDKRKLFFRLGQPGDEDRSFTWASQEEPETDLVLTSVSGTFEEGEVVNFTDGASAIVSSGGTTNISIRYQDSDSYSTGNTVTGATSAASGTLSTFSQSFSGADKDISDIKEALDALFTEIKNLKGTRGWFNPAFNSANGISEQLNSQLVQNTVDAKFAWDGSNMSVSDESGTPADADILGLLRIFGRAGDLGLTRQDGTGGSAVIPVAEDEIVFIKIPDSGDRNYSGVGSGDTNYQVAAIEDYEISDENYWIAYRKLNRLYIRGYGELETGEEIIISDPQKEDLEQSIADNLASANQDRTMKLVGGGTWSHSQTGFELTLSSAAYIQIPGITKESNQINPQTITLSNADDVAYVTVNRVDGAATISVSVAQEEAVVLDNDTFIIARRIGSDIVVGGSFQLKAGEFLELDGALAEINRFFGLLRLTPHESDTNQVRISAAEISKLSGSVIRLSLKNLLLSFDGAVIDFSTGEIFESDGITPFNGGANDFTPFAIGASEYFFYSVNIIPDASAANNELTGQVLILPASASDAVLADAPRAAFSKFIGIGQVYVQEDGGGGLEDITYDNIIITSPGGSGSGSGSGFVKVNYHDPISTTLPVGASVTIDNASGVDGDLVLFTNLSNPSENNKVYELSGVGSSIVWTPTLDFNLGVAEDGDTVIVLAGEAFREAIGKFDGTNWVFNDTVRYYSGADYWEQSSLKTSDILNATTDNIFTVDLAGSENMIVDYSIFRGSLKETGMFIITSDGTNVNYAQYSANIGLIGVELFADISGSDVRFRYTSDGSGAGTIKYSVKRWSNASGGPGGVPSYSGATGSGGAAAGANLDIQYNAAGSLAGDSSYQWDPATKTIKIGDLSFVAMNGSVTINDNQGSPANLINLPVANSKFAVIEYSIERDTGVRVGRLLVCTNGTLTALTDDNTDVGGGDVDDLSIPITATVSGGSVLVRYTSTSTGNTGTFKYSLRKWL